MLNSNVAQTMGFDIERTVSGPFTSSFQLLGGPLTVNPVIMIFDNQSTVAVILSVDGVNAWKTFSPGEALTIDCRSNHGLAANYTAPLGTQFYVFGTAGAGKFSLAITYAE